MVGHLHHGRWQMLRGRYLWPLAAPGNTHTLRMWKTRCYTLTSALLHRTKLPDHGILTLGLRVYGYKRVWLLARCLQEGWKCWCGTPQVPSCASTSGTARSQAGRGSRPRDPGPQRHTPGTAPLPCVLRLRDSLHLLEVKGCTWKALTVW